MWWTRWTVNMHWFSRIRRSIRSGWISNRYSTIFYDSISSVVSPVRSQREKVERTIHWSWFRTRFSMRNFNFYLSTKEMTFMILCNSFNCMSWIKIILNIPIQSVFLKNISLLSNFHFQPECARVRLTTKPNPRFSAQVHSPI